MRNVFGMIGLLALCGCAQWKAEVTEAGIRPAGEVALEERTLPNAPIVPASFSTKPGERAISEGKQHYRDGAYGLAEQSFRRAIEEDANNMEGWLGLAASYDRLRRFDLAERAYDVLVRKVGYTPSVLNNLGYHNYLKGNRDLARKNFEAAAKAEPGNPTFKNNLAMLEN